MSQKQLSNIKPMEQQLPLVSCKKMFFFFNKLIFKLGPLKLLPRRLQTFALEVASGNERQKAN